MFVDNKDRGSNSGSSALRTQGRIFMRRREFLKYSAATAVAAPFVRAARADAGTYKVGVIGAKTGPLAPGAAVTHFPPYRLWAHEVNERGGLKLKDGARKIELVEYDDRTQPPEAIKAVERAATVDKCDWIGGVYATGFNLATAPTFAKHGYPQLTQACVTDQGPKLVKQYPGFFMFQSSTTAYAKGTIDVLKKLKDNGQIGNKVAAVNVGDDFGIELANAGRPLFKAAGFDIVYDKSYPLGTQDYAPVVKAAKAKPADVKAIGLSGQMHGSVFLDKRDKVVRRAILWNDQRTAAECTEIERRAGGREAVIDGSFCRSEPAAVFRGLT